MVILISQHIVNADVGKTHVSENDIWKLKNDEK